MSEFTKNDLDLLNLYLHIVLVPFISTHLEPYIDRAIYVQSTLFLAPGAPREIACCTMYRNAKYVAYFVLTYR